MKNTFIGIETEMQLLFSLADQYVFGSEIGDLTELTPDDIYAKVHSGICELQRELTHLPLGESGTNMYPSMSLLAHNHFVTYGGGYYSYLFAKMYAAQIWQKHFTKDPLSQESGRIFREKLLRYGSSGDHSKILEDIGGGPLNPSWYIEQILSQKQKL